ncbi:hypothetical protein ACVW1A_005196 [Bradyrhizobium sp. LB1.3]
MSKANLLDRRQVVSALLANRKDVVAIGGLGASTNDMCAAGDHARNFYLWGGMGGAAMIGLGLALAQPKLPVLVITGDGEMLMGLGQPRHHRPAEAVQPLDRGARQRGLWRDRRPDQPHLGRRRPRRRRQGLRHRG